MNDALQAAMLSPTMEFSPNLWTTPFDEVLAIRIGWLVVDHELGYLLGPVLATIAFDQAIDRCFNLKQSRASAVLDW
jgi:hypothetical protein